MKGTTTLTEKPFVLRPDVLDVVLTYSFQINYKHEEMWGKLFGLIRIISWLRRL